MMLSLIIVSSACNKTGFDENGTKKNVFFSGDPSLVQKLQAFIDNDGNGPSINLQSDAKRFSFSARFSKIYENPSLNVLQSPFLRSTFDINMNINPDATVFSSNDPNLKSLFGTEAYFDVNIPNAGSWKEKIYVPNLLNATINMQDGTSVTKSNGLELNWEIDKNPLNDKGVLIELYYDPFTNKSVSSNPNNLPNQAISKYIAVSDYGQYHLNSTDFAELPSNANITVKIYRGNFKTINIGKEQQIGLLVYDQFYNAFTLID